MKNTPLKSRHEALHAKMTDFAGYHMPLLYSTVREEHLAVRAKSGLFDVSHMGEFIIKGRQALDLVQYVVSNDVTQLQIGEAQYAYLPNERGGIVDDLLIYRLDEDQCSEGEQAFMLVVNASNIEKDLQWIQDHNTFDTRIINISEQTGLLALQGPESSAILQLLTDLDLSAIPYYTFKKGALAGVSNVIVSATGYTGSGGFELYADNGGITQLWDAIMQVNDPPTPVGLGARDTLRLEKGYCLYGNDIDDETSPLEAGLSWITKMAKDDFVGKNAIQKQKDQGVVRKLVGFKMEDRRVPRKGYAIVNDAGEEIGEVTSGTFSPTLEVPIGMGYVDKVYSKKTSEIYIAVGKKTLKGIVQKVPFC